VDARRVNDSCGAANCMKAKRDDTRAREQPIGTSLNPLRPD